MREYPVTSDYNEFIMTVPPRDVKPARVIADFFARPLARVRVVPRRPTSADLTPLQHRSLGACGPVGRIRPDQTARWPEPAMRRGCRPATTDEVIVDIDGTLLDAHSDKQDATPAYKRGFGFYPILAYLDATFAGVGRVAATGPGLLERRRSPRRLFDTAEGFRHQVFITAQTGANIAALELRLHACDLAPLSFRRNG